MKFRNLLPQLSLLIVLMLIVACQSAPTSTEEPQESIDLITENGGETPSPIPATAVPSPTFTPQPTATATPLPTNTPKPTPTLTPTPNAETLYEENYQKGINYAEDENWEKAVEALLAAVESDPDNGQIYKAYNALGLSYDRLGELDRAIANFDQAIDNNPTFADCYANRGDVWRDLGEPEKAFADYDQAIELDPTVPRYFYNRAITYKWQGELEQAIADYDQAIELDPEFAYAYHNRANIYWTLGNTTQALADFDKALELDPTDKLGYLNRGLLQLDRNNPEAARKDFSQIIDICNPITFATNDGAANSLSFDSNCTYAYLLRAEIEYQANNYEASLIDLEMGVDDNPPLALDYFDYYISNNPNWGYPYFGHGLAQASLGNQEEALADYTQAIQLSASDPMRQNYYLARGIIYAGQGNLEAAIADWQQTVTIAPQNADAYFNLSMAYHELENYEAAVQNLLTLLAQDIPEEYKLDAANRLLYNAEFLIYFSENQEQASLAVTAYKFLNNDMAEMVIPGDQFNNLCWFASLWELAEDVMFACEAAVTIDPENASYLDSRGLARAMVGNFEGAIEDFTAYIIWHTESDGSQEEVALREAWIETLESGSSPFDEETIAAMRRNQ